MLKRYIKLVTAAALLALVLSLALPLAASADTLYISPNFKSTYNATLNEIVTFSVQATGGEGTLGFQWYHTAGALAGCTNSVLTFSATGNDVIWCMVTSGTQSAETIHCSVYVNGSYSPTPTQPSSYLNPNITPTAPTITVQPKSVAPVLGYANGSLTVGAAHDYAGLGLEIRYQWYQSSTNNMAYGAPITGATSATYNLPAAAGAGKLFYCCGVYTTNGVTDSEIVYSNMVYAYFGGKVEVEITKSPTDETVAAGGKATFIANADNADSYQWRIVRSDGSFIPAEQARYSFNGLEVIMNQTSDGREVLTLKNIPYEMNGMSIICVYYDTPQKLNFKITNSARLYVSAPAATPTPAPSASAYIPGATATLSPAALTNGIISTPTISTQPEGAVVEEGTTTTLSVAAANTAGEGSELRYQWYKNDKNSNANGTAIAGAQSASYTPEKISGSKYYYVGVWATDGSKTSKVVYSTPVAVTYTAAVSTSPSPTPTMSISVKPANDSSILSQLALPIIAMLIAAAIAVAAVVILKKMKAAEREDERRRDYGSKYDDDIDSYDDRRRSDDRYPRRR